MYDDMTYSLLVEMVVKKFNLDPNDRLNLSFKLLSLDSQLAITDDEDVKLFVDYDSSSTDGISHLYVCQPKNKSKDNTHSSGYSSSGVAPQKCRRVMEAGCLGDMKNYCKNRKLETVIGVIMSCTPNALGDLTVTLKDLSGTMGGTIHYKVFKEEGGYAKSINARVVLIVLNVSVLTQNHQIIILTLH
uniref:Homologous recombination OB-fold protein OB-fold domain-containing protein n=1 Tax=Tanacetum cinerariifolium TaxID=118510 RepID=A0A699HQ01_TANCI|nr:hypothetical protein [Tanacetum cinerariifolium]